MNKRVVTIVAFAALAIVTICACKGRTKKVDESLVVKEGATTEKQISAPEFDGLVKIFAGFEEIVAKNRDNPPKGVEACSEYAKKSIPKIKSLENEIKKYETKGEYLSGLIQTNDKIKEISDRVSKIVADSYGIHGADILMQLSDMALARL